MSFPAEGWAREITAYRWYGRSFVQKGMRATFASLLDLGKPMVIATFDTGAIVRFTPAQASQVAGAIQKFGKEYHRAADLVKAVAIEARSLAAQNAEQPSDGLGEGKDAD